MEEILDKKSKDLIEFKSSLELSKCTDKSTYVFLVISHPENSKNDIIKLSCKQMIALNGYAEATGTINIKPNFGGYVYDGVNDTYLIKCIDFVHLGLIPFYHKIKLENIGSWNLTVPIPEKTLFRVFSKDQKDLVAKYKNDSVYDNFYFNYVQFLIG